MTRTAWRLANSVATLELDSLHARLDVGAPHQGMGFLGSPARALAIELGAARGSVGALIDCFARGNALIATYAPTEKWPVLLELDWRATAATANLPARIDLQVSVHTDRLDSDPELSIGATWTANEIFSYSDKSNAWTARDDARHGELTSLVVCRQAGDAPSYVQMIHPSDFCGQQFAARDGDIALRAPLFRQRLEKGVIRRARIRAALVPRAHDLEIARGMYEQFAAEEADLSA
ncbi:MAG: hypothetical protein K1X71_18535 [Pirellulales bacterium]|nr:hypothetical protein [Pirellulales bacterium]